MITIGLREEDKYVAERRVAIIPEHIKKLKEKNNIEVYFTPSKKRSFKDEEFLKIGCKPSETLSEADVIFGVKEIPVSFFEKNKTYIFFSHTIKGQSYNIPMLKKMMELNCTLIDYERIVDDNNKRLIFFGKFAGLAGAINSLWALGLKYKEKGIETPFLHLKQTYLYKSLAEAKNEVKKVGDLLKLAPLPKEITPIIIGITGYGNVSKGAQEIISLLPTKEIFPEDLSSIDINSLDSKFIYTIIFKEQHLYKTENEDFNLEHFYKNSNLYVSDFDQYIPKISLLLNCMYWDSNCDRLITKAYLKKHWRDSNFRLEVIGDITCDPNGSIEPTHSGTDIEDPIFVYHPETELPTFGYKGEGILIMAVDILPSELSYDASISFSTTLSPFLEDIVNCDYNLPFLQLDLPTPVKKAVILHKGKLTDDYIYLQKYL